MAPRPTGSDVVLSHFKKKVGRRLSASVAALSERIPCTQQLLSTFLPTNMIDMLLVMNEESVVQCMSHTHIHILYITKDLKSAKRGSQELGSWPDYGIGTYSTPYSQSKESTRVSHCRDTAEQ